MTNIDTTYIDNIRKQDNDVLTDVQNIQAFSGQELINNEIMVLIAHIQKLERGQGKATQEIIQANQDGESPIHRAAGKKKDKQ